MSNSKLNMIVIFMTTGLFVCIWPNFHFRVTYPFPIVSGAHFYWVYYFTHYDSMTAKFSDLKRSEMNRLGLSQHRCTGRSENIGFFTKSQVSSQMKRYKKPYFLSTSGLFAKRLDFSASDFITFLADSRRLSVVDRRCFRSVVQICWEHQLRNLKIFFSLVGCRQSTFDHGTSTRPLAA